MTWMCVTLPDDTAIQEANFQDTFWMVWNAAGAPPEAIMYRTESSINSQYFFTPAAVSIARPLLLKFGGKDCPEPNIGELIIMVKNEGAPIRS
jgi:hypothetical protein